MTHTWCLLCRCYWEAGDEFRTDRNFCFNNLLKAAKLDPSNAQVNEIHPKRIMNSSSLLQSLALHASHLLCTKVSSSSTFRASKCSSGMHQKQFSCYAKYSYST